MPVSKLPIPARKPTSTPAPTLNTKVRAAKDRVVKSPAAPAREYMTHIKSGRVRRAASLSPLEIKQYRKSKLIEIALSGLT